MQMLFGAFAFRPDLEPVMPLGAAARDSLASFLSMEGDCVPLPHRQQLQQHADSPIAPKTVGQWRELYSHTLLPCWRQTRVA